MTTVDRTRFWTIVIAVVGMSAAVVLAQSRTTDADAGSMAALIAEVRQLRLAVEQSARSQTQTQALSVYLSAQQARLVQVAAQLDSSRKELGAASDKVREVADRLSNLDGVPDAFDPSERAQVEKAIAQQRQALKQEQTRMALQEEQARSREAELVQMFQVEESRWSDLIARLEQQLVKP